MLEKEDNEISPEWINKMKTKGVNAAMWAHGLVLTFNSNSTLADKKWWLLLFITNPTKNQVLKECKRPGQPRQAAALVASPAPVCHPLPVTCCCCWWGSGSGGAEPFISGSGSRAEVFVGGSGSSGGRAEPFMGG